MSGDAIEAYEPRQVRKEATISSKLLGACHHSYKDIYDMIFLYNRKVIDNF